MVSLPQLIEMTAVVAYCSLTLFHCHMGINWRVWLLCISASTLLDAIAHSAFTYGGPGMPPKTLRQPHIFISFKTEERKSAAALKEILEAGGFSVWWQESIQCGREWHGDIDSAILSSGCIVVLWSPASVESPWVRHEASQAVARGVYTPVRLVPMVIGSPFDRIQATDLFGWEGESNHPGLLRLLARANQLIPPILAPHQRLLRYIAANRMAFITAAVAIVSIGMLVRLSIGLETQLAEQASIAQSIQRTLQPLSDFRVTAYLTVEPTTPGVAEYLARLRKLIPIPENGILPDGTPLPRGVSMSSGGASGGIAALRIQFGSELWPVDTTDSWLDTVSQYAELRIGFSRTKSTTSARPDLAFYVGGHDPDGSDGQRNTSSVIWELATNKLELSFHDVASKESWDSSGEVVAVPDLETCMIRIEIDSTMYRSLNDAAAMAGTEASRRSLKLSTIFLDISGRRMMIVASAMQSTTGTKGMPAYVGEFGLVSKKI